jgi:cysteine synthase A
VRLNRVGEGLKPEIMVKLEYFSPSGSLKDRIYLNMIEKAEQRGVLKPGMTILECSTGNAGIACSFVSAVKGYPCVIVMPEGMSDERKKMNVAYGTKMIYTRGGESDVDLALEKLEEIRRQEPEKYWVPSQFDNPDNIKAHYKTTGPEIWEQTRGKLDAYVATQGTGGQLTGIGRYLRERKKSVKLYAGEPAECPLLSRREWGEHKIEGIGDGFVPRDLDLSLLTGVVTITSDEAIEMARRLAKEEGIFCGISSGANVVAAMKVASQHPKMKRIVTMICDTGQRYFSTELCGEPKHVNSPEREHPMDDYTRAELDKYQSTWEIIG